MRFHGLRRHGARLAALPVAVLLAGALLVPGASAVSVAEAEAEADRLGMAIAQTAEEYNAAEGQLGPLTEQLELAKQRQADQERLIADLQDDMVGVARQAYKTGGIDPAISLMSDDPLGYLQNAALLDNISSTQALTLGDYEAALAQLERDEADVAAKLAAVDQLKQTLAAKKAEIEQQLADAQQVLAEAQRIEAERAAAALAASRARTTTTTQDGGGGADGGRASVPVGMSCNDVAITAPNATAAAAVEFACRQLGKPYQWGAEGPGSYDCSGLTSAAYAYAGVSIPRASRQQYGVGSSVSRGNIQAGDLVFYASGSTVSHVGIAITNDLMIDAYRTGKPVEIRSISRLAQYLNYVGAKRIS